MNRKEVYETVVNVDDRIEKYKAQLSNLVEENNLLCDQIVNKG